MPKAEEAGAVGVDKMPSGRGSALGADYGRAKGVRLQSSYYEQSCTLDSRAVGGPCPCGRPTWRAGAWLLKKVGPKWRIPQGAWPK